MPLAQKTAADKNMSFILSYIIDVIARCRCKYRHIHDWLFPPDHSLRLHRVYAFCYDDDKKDSDFLELTDIPIDEWLNVLESNAWSSYKIEMRFTCHGHKYRIIMRDSDVSLPSMTLPETPHSPNKIIVTALLYWKEGGASNIHRRIQKYHGPARDWFGCTTLTIADLFPFDDAEDLNDRIKCLELIRMDFDRGGLVKDVYTANEIIS